METLRSKRHGVTAVRRRAVRATGVALAALVVAGPVPAYAVATDPADPLLEMLDACPVVSTGALGEMRGGYRLAGIDVEFGARLRTLVNGVKILESVLQFGEQGPRLVQQPVATGAQGESAAPEVGGLPATIPAAETTAAAAEVAVVLVSPLAEEAVIQRADGATTISNRVTDRGIVSALSTEASGQSIRREISIDLTIKNFSDLQRALRAVSTAERVGRAGR